MKAKGLRGRVALALAFLMGVPVVAQAGWDGLSGIIGSALALAFGIVDIAGDS